MSDTVDPKTLTELRRALALLKRNRLKRSALPAQLDENATADDVKAAVNKILEVLNG